MTEFFAELLRLDGGIVLFVQEHVRTGALDGVMAALSLIGNAGVAWLLLGAALTAREKYRRRGLALFACLTVCFIINNLIIKNAVARPRPFEVVEGLRILISAPGDYSFPSGHAASGFAAAYSISRTLSRRAAICAFVLASLIALSRVYVGVHYPSDVVAGAILGTLCAAAVLAALKSFKLRPLQTK
ncbi:MAG: phosphatase PAP2 family protein [Oscillospiraceae bacterium]|nr:phosphatase PAP2 family protein [Oscillospiraceae bacterium]